MKTRKNTGRVIAQLRKVIGKSQTQFAALIGVSKHTIISVENGRNKLSKNLARRIQIATGAEVFDEKLRFQPVLDLPAAASPGKLTLEASTFLRTRYDGSGKYDDVYTREDFEQWRANFYPSNDQTARTSFDKIKTWLEFIFRAAAKPGVAGNRDRLPAVYQSLVEWLNETREHFRLENQVDDLLEKETHVLGEAAYSVNSLKESQDLPRIKDEFASYGYDFAEVKKQLKKAKPHDWIVLEIECRREWDPFTGTATVPCETRTLLPKPKFRFVDGWDYLGPKLGTSKEQVLQQLAEFQAKQRGPK